MIGVTLSVGSAVVSSAMSQFGAIAFDDSVGASLQRSSLGTQVGLVYAVVASSGGCPAYQGNNEGTGLSVALYNFGSSSFRPALFVVNSTAFAGTYAALGPRAMSVYAIGLGFCAHSGGQTVIAVDNQGDELLFGS